MIAIYARQSADKKDSISIEGQIERCIAEADKASVLDGYRVYQDKGYSGKNTERPQFSAMMKDVEDGQIDQVIVYKIDRISRAIVDFGKIMADLDHHEVEFISCTEKFDTSTPIGRAMLNIIMVFAQLERETIQNRIRDNYYQRGRMGFYLGGYPPFGYNKTEAVLNGKKTYAYIINEQEKDTVCGIFEEYGHTSASLGSIAKRLNRDGVRTRLSNAWSGATLGRVLRNPVYVRADADIYSYLKNKNAVMNNEIDEYLGENGCYVYAERHSVTTSKFTDLSSSYVTLGLHQGIIPAGLWLRCQDKLDHNKQVKNSGKGSHSWLSGLMKCGYCGRAVSIVNNNRGYRYINCGGRKLKICEGRKRALRFDDIEKIAEESLLSYIGELEYRALPEVQVDGAGINKLKIRLAQIEERIKNLIGHLAEGNELTVGYINQAVADLDREKQAVSEKILKATVSDSGPRPPDFDIKECIRDWPDLGLENKKRIAGIFIEQVVITDDRIDIFFN